MVVRVLDLSKRSDTGVLVRDMAKLLSSLFVCLLSLRHVLLLCHSYINWRGVKASSVAAVYVCEVSICMILAI